MVEVNNLTGIGIEAGSIKRIAEKVLKGERGNKAEISIAFVNPAKIRQLNKKYRKKDGPTDVLSYTYSKGSGEIIICPQVVRGNAKKFGATFKKELTRVLIHGILHFLGYDHEKGWAKAKKMEKKEEHYISSVARNIPRGISHSLKY